MALTSSSRSVAVTSGSPSIGDRPLAELELGERGRQLRIVGAPIAARRHPHGERLGPVFVGMFLRVPARQMANETAAERLRTVILAIRLRDGAEQLHPRFEVVELVGVVDDVTHLVAQIAKDVGVIETFDVADLLAVQGRQIGMSEIERNPDDDGAERHAPFGRQMKTRDDSRDAALRELGAELVDHGREPRALDHEAEVADRRAEQVGFVKNLRRGHEVP